MTNTVTNNALPVLLWGVLSLCASFMQSVAACGYSFVGGCSTHIGLQINGTRDSFPVDACAFGGAFEGLQFGKIRSLRMRSVNAITWESCINNVTSVTLYYRIYETGTNGGNWSTFSLNQDSTRLQGPYTSRYRSAYTDIDLTQGLIIGRNYSFEVYYSAQIDTIGDDFIPETTLLQNNKGKNYTLFFEYGGMAAPPFTTVVTRRENALCYQDSSGIAGVSIFGEAQNVRYQWSSSSDNYHTIFRLPKGSYSVTVTSSNADDQVRTVFIDQPAPLNATIMDIEPAGCNNRPGSATAMAFGGTAPYRYSWSSGTSGATGSFPTAGLWQLSVLDDHNCAARLSAQIPFSNTIAQRIIETEICQGDTFTINQTKFFKTGLYEYNIPNPVGCDTLVRISLKVINADSALLFLPDTARIVCLSPSIDLCALAVTGQSFMWKKDNTVLNSTACYTATSGGEYEISGTLAGRIKVCTARKTIYIEARLSPPMVTTESRVRTLPCRSDSVEVEIIASVNTRHPSFEWKVDGNVLSTQAVLRFLTIPARLPDLTIALSVTDEYGCHINSNQFALSAVNPPDPLVISLSGTDASGAQETDGTVEVTALAGTRSYQYKWSNGGTTARQQNLLPGTYCVTVEDGSGCKRMGCQTISYTSAAHEAMPPRSFVVFPNPAARGSVVRVRLPRVQPAPEYRFMLFDAAGCLRQEGVLTGESLTLPDTLPFGWYVMTLLLPEGVLKGRILIENSN